MSIGFNGKVNSMDYAEALRGCTEYGQFQYYYKDNKCRVNTAKDADCICWRDEGTGHYKDEKHDAEHPLVEWRIKPSGR